MLTFNDPDARNHEGCGADGMALADEFVARYVDAWGEPLDDLAWFRALAAYRFAIITGFNLALHSRGERPVRSGRHRPVDRLPAVTSPPGAYGAGRVARADQRQLARLPTR